MGEEFWLTPVYIKQQQAVHIWSDRPRLENAPGVTEEFAPVKDRSHSKLAGQWR